MLPPNDRRNDGLIKITGVAAATFVSAGSEKRRKRSSIIQEDKDGIEPPKRVVGQRGPESHHQLFIGGPLFRFFNDASLSHDLACDTENLAQCLQPRLVGGLNRFNRLTCRTFGRGRVEAGSCASMERQLVPGRTAVKKTAPVQANSATTAGRIGPGPTTRLRRGRIVRSPSEKHPLPANTQLRALADIRLASRRTSRLATFGERKVDQTAHLQRAKSRSDKANAMAASMQLA